ncbi:MAG: acetylornithine transaminase [Syntrophales bacterium]|jgi:acetylornithine aminotransferase/acetylornithine/N-succinyldiaminopimelate aminotransferase|nr:acetylornithine transaminase [Syntrophales bacterium]
MTTDEFIDSFNSCVMGTYNRLPVVFVKGSGARLWDREGKEYLDFLAGIAVCALGHSHPKVVKAIQEQAARLMHVSNIFYIEPQEKLASLLVEHSFADKVFFCNSGAEANEAAIKLARRYANARSSGRQYEIITMKDSFHGRTLATVTATGQEKFQAGLDPLPRGFRYVPFNDLEALKESFTEHTCAVMVEVIQGEGGIRVPDEGYLRGVRELCNERELLMIIDEVQTGMGRTGTLFAYEPSGITPDIVTMAKAMGNGFPLGAMLATDTVASAFVPGTHASTFGGNPLAMAAGIATMEALLDDGVIDKVSETGDYFCAQLQELAKKYEVMKNIRGKGLMIGVELACEGAPIVYKALEKGFLFNCTAGSVLRFVPPLIITAKDVDRAIGILDDVMRSV